MIHDNLGNMTVKVTTFMHNLPERVLANTKQLSLLLSAGGFDSTQREAAVLLASWGLVTCNGQHAIFTFQTCNCGCLLRIHAGLFSAVVFFPGK